MEVMELIKISFLHVVHLVFVCTATQKEITSTAAAAQWEDEKSSFHPFLPSSSILFAWKVAIQLFPTLTSTRTPFHPLKTFRPTKFSILKDYPAVLPWQPRRWCEEFRLSSDRLISLGDDDMKDVKLLLMPGVFCCLCSWLDCSMRVGMEIRNKG